MTANEFIEFKTGKSSVLERYSTHTVIELMRQWEEYTNVRRMLYSINPVLNQDELGIFNDNDLLIYLNSTITNNETN